MPDIRENLPKKATGETLLVSSLTGEDEPKSAARAETCPENGAGDAIEIADATGATLGSTSA